MDDYANKRTNKRTNGHTKGHTTAMITTLFTLAVIVIGAYVTINLAIWIIAIILHVLD